MRLFIRTCYAIVFSVCIHTTQAQMSQPISYKDFIAQSCASKEEIDVFLNEPSWAKFDSELGYILGNYFPNDGWNDSRTISTSNPIGHRTSFVYKTLPCRINTYGNSFTQCHQVSDAETWQEYLAGHLGEPIRNFGMGGFGVYQSYRRMLREEQTDNAADNIILYIWGDDHIRSLFRSRYVVIGEWNHKTNKMEGVGKMFHGNFWSNIEMNLETGMLEEFDNRIKTKEDLYQMTNKEWMYNQLKDDLGIQLHLLKNGKIHDFSEQKMVLLAKHLRVSFDPKAADIQKEAENLLKHYSYAATKYILNKAKLFAEAKAKKLMVVLFDPYRVTKQLIKGENRTDQTIVDYLESNQFDYFDMNVVHAEDFKNFNLDLDQYYQRYFIGHYNPSGNHFFAYSIAPVLVDWLEPKPVTYARGSEQKTIDFKDYLQGVNQSKTKED